MKKWLYEVAFKRNLGLISPAEQQTLRQSHVTIAGMGGVGGIHAVTLARLGIGNFTIADPDTFGIENTNRQYGATSSTEGRNKAEIMAQIIHDVNPEVNLTVFTDSITPKNSAEFLKDTDLFIDSLDAFNIDMRRVLYRLTAEKGKYTVSAGPFGFSTGWLVFSPDGMSFDRYFDLTDDLSEAEKFIAFVVGVAPKGTHLSYLDKTYVDFKNHTGPSVGFACALAAGVVGVETVKILLGRGTIYPAPYYRQFDPYIGRFVKGKLRGGNRHPWQRIKRWYLMGYARKHKLL